MQTPVQYGENVYKYDALDAVKNYRPKIVIGAWVTHKFNPNEYYREGNQWGIDEIKLFGKVKKYIHIGNEHTHRHKPILGLPHREVKAEWLVSRSNQPEKNVIWIWEK
jgi:hypothetical protein